jgi:uncharacterized membrane protein
MVTTTHGWTVLVALHAAAATSCLFLGAYQLLRRTKGDRAHRVLGWFWVSAMLFVASSSFAIRQLRKGDLSLLHVLSVVTLVTATLGVIAIRRGNVRAHRNHMLGNYLGLIGAFIGAVAVPSRLIPTFAVDEPVGALAALAAVVALTAAVLVVAHGLDRLNPSVVRERATAR